MQHKIIKATVKYLPFLPLPPPMGEEGRLVEGLSEEVCNGLIEEELHVEAPMGAGTRTGTVVWK